MIIRRTHSEICNFRRFPEDRGSFGRRPPTNNGIIRGALNSNWTAACSFPREPLIRKSNSFLYECVPFNLMRFQTVSFALLLLLGRRCEVARRLPDGRGAISRSGRPGPYYYFNYKPTPTWNRFVSYFSHQNFIDAFNIFLRR